MKPRNPHLSLTDLRTEFPHTESLVYLNHAATSPLSRRVIQSIDAFLQQRHRGPVENYLDFAPVVEETLQKFATMIGAEKRQVELVPNTSYGLSILAEGLDWRPGDRIAIPGCEFPANVYPFLNLRERGVEVDFIPHHEATFTLEDVERTLRSETRLVSVSWVQFLSGFRCDLEAIAALCHDRGLLLAVDAIQGLGALQLDVVRSGIDFLASGAHKWMMATQGIGCVYVSARALEAIRPKAGWLHGPVDWENFFDYRLAFHPDARRFRLGTLNGAGVAALHAALGLYLELGPDWCEERVLENAQYLDSQLVDAGLTPYGRSAGPAPSSGIATYRSGDSQGLFDYLMEHHVSVSLRNGLIRFAPTYYNTFEELDRAAMLVRDYLQRGMRG